MTDERPMLPVFRPPVLPENWKVRAACRGEDPNLFHPGPGYGAAAYRQARKICARCPVGRICLAYGQAGEGESPPYGMWGGLTPRERAALPQRRRKRAFGHQDAAPAT